jgi:hypothetical protein
MLSATLLWMYSNFCITVLTYYISSLERRDGHER